MTIRFEERYFTTRDGLRLYYRDYPRTGSQAGAGAGASTSIARAKSAAGQKKKQHETVLVCLHGLTRNSLDFESLVPHWQQYFRILTIDMRGRGRSDYDPNWRNYHIGRYAVDAWRWLESLGVQKCILLGNSMGGLVAMLMASQKPRYVRALVMNDIGPELMPQGIARILTFLEPQHTPVDFDSAVARVKALNQSFFPNLSEADWVIFTRNIGKQDADGKWISAYDPGITKALAHVELLDDNLWHIYERLGSVPTLVLRGELSDLLSPEILVRMQQVKPDIEIATITRRGHHPFLNEPDSVAALQDFFRKQGLIDTDD